MRRLLSFILIVGCLLSCQFAARADEWEEALPAEAEVEFYLDSPLRGQAQLEVAPGQRAELTAKLNELARLENLRLRRHTRGYKAVPTRRTPFHTWELRCRIPGQEAPTKGFLMRGRTWIGGFTENEFDAARYFTPASWQAAWEKLAIPGADDADCVAGYAERTEDAWPDAGAADEVWELPEALSPEDNITFYIKNRYHDDVPEIEITPLPERRAEFIAKLNKLGYLDKRCKYGNKSDPSNRLYCRTPKVKYMYGFALRADTWIGGESNNEFNAAAYFSPEDWERVETAYGKPKLQNSLTNTPYKGYKHNRKDTWLEPDTTEPEARHSIGNAVELRGFLPPEQLLVTSKLGKGSAELRPIPIKEETLRALLMVLRRLDYEFRTYSKDTFRMPVCQTYALFYNYKAEKYSSDSELFLWNTHIGGGYCGYWFDAASYITADSWAELRTKLSCEYDQVGYTTPFAPTLPQAELPTAQEVTSKMPQALNPEEDITFYMHHFGYIDSRGHVIAELVPELREEFIRKINRMGKLENRFTAWMHAQGGWVHTMPPPTLSYELRCRTAHTDYTSGFSLICRTWIGRLNIERYITPRSWQEIQAKLRTPSDEDTDAEATPPEEDDGKPATPLSMSFFSDGKKGNPTAWCEWVQDTAEITVQREDGKSIPLSPEDRRAVLSLITQAKTITRGFTGPVVELLLALYNELRDEDHATPAQQPSIGICFLDADGDYITVLDWAEFHTESEYLTAESGFLLPKKVYKDIARRLQAAILRAGAGE